MSLPTLPDGARWVHAIGDDPRDCWACAGEGPGLDVGPHDAAPSGEGDDDGPYCFCGHHLTAERTDWLVLRIRHDQPTAPTDALAKAACEMLARALDAAGITAVVDVRTEPEP